MPGGAGACDTRRRASQYLRPPICRIELGKPTFVEEIGGILDQRSLKVCCLACGRRGLGSSQVVDLTVRPLVEVVGYGVALVQTLFGSFYAFDRTSLTRVEYSGVKV